MELWIFFCGSNEQRWVATSLIKDLHRTAFPFPFWHGAGNSLAVVEDNLLTWDNWLSGFDYIGKIKMGQRTQCKLCEMIWGLAKQRDLSQGGNNAEVLQNSKRSYFGMCTRIFFHDGIVFLFVHFN